MQDKVLKILEFDKIISRLSESCYSSIAVELAENLKPTGNYDEVKILQHETSQAVSMIISKGTPPFGGFKDIRNSLLKVGKGAVLTAKELLDTADTLRASRNLKAYHGDATERSGREAISERHHSYDIIDPFFENLYSNKRVEEKIFACVVNEDEIADTASPALHSIRRSIIDTEQRIKEKLNSMIHSSSYQKYLQESIVTIRAGRYVLPVKQEYRNEVPGLVHDSSASGATLFIEPMAIVEANNSIKQLKAKEAVEIEKILSELTSLVSVIVTELEACIHLMAKLDLIFSKARLSLDMNAVQPRLNQSGVFNIRKGRHPLLAPEKAVPIDIRCGSPFSILVVTGPNTGGKTVTLKTVGLLTLMAQAGLNIPAAEDTEINVFGKIFADIGDEQSIEQSLSTFSAHMVNIVRILEEVDLNSLVLLDELGAGTDPVEGAALAMSILEKLHKCGAKTVATTHYSELKTFAIKKDGIENACCEFDVETLKPTYKVLIGVPGKSNAFAISKKLGLKEDIIETARQFISNENTKFEDVIAEVEKNRVTSQKELEAAESIKNEYMKLKEELETKIEAVKKQKEKLVREAKQEAKSVLMDAKEEAEKILNEIKKLADADESKRNKEGEKLKRKLRDKLNDMQETHFHSADPDDKEYEHYAFKSGDSVYIKSLNQEGVVLSAPDENNNVQIQAGIVKLKLHVSQLTPVKTEKVSFGGTGIKGTLSNKDRVVPMELSVRGQTLDEALENTDRYLDNVCLAGLKTVTIIHGKGTGTLRKGIHGLLKKHPHVKSFRLGKYGEGEHGVTIVELY